MPETTARNVGTMTLEQKIRRYEELKEMIKTLEAEKSEISGSFRTGLDAFGVQEMQVPVGELNYQLKIVSKTNRSCNYDALKAQYEDIYNQFVRETASSYVDIRPKLLPASSRPGVVLAEPSATNGEAAA